MSGDPDFSAPRSYFPRECVPEIERALVACLWHEPNRLAETLRWLEPQAHLTIPFLRLVVEAINRCYREENDCDFGTVAACLRQLGNFEECGGLEGLDQLYCDRFYGPLFDCYGVFIREAALRRSGDPKAPPSRFSGGRGRLVTNKVRRTEASPAWKGEARIAGQNYLIEAWLSKAGTEVQLKFVPL